MAGDEKGCEKLIQKNLSLVKNNRLFGMVGNAHHFLWTKGMAMHSRHLQKRKKTTYLFLSIVTKIKLSFLQ
jgi:hypothetical protein